MMHPAYKMIPLSTRKRVLAWITTILAVTLCLTAHMLAPWTTASLAVVFGIPVLVGFAYWEGAVRHIEED